MLFFFSIIIIINVIENGITSRVSPNLNPSSYTDGINIYLLLSNMPIAIGSACLSKTRYFGIFHFTKRLLTNPQKIL